jgi:antitoxin MazE6
MHVIDIGINLVIHFVMKTAISIPDPVFNAAERLAKRLGLSRSELYVRAISSYVEKHTGQKVTDLLNEIYGGTENQELETGFKRAQMKSINKEKW